jgi:hypothetical protein
VVSRFLRLEKHLTDVNDAFVALLDGEIVNAADLRCVFGPHSNEVGALELLARNVSIDLSLVTLQIPQESGQREDGLRSEREKKKREERKRQGAP